MRYRIRTPDNFSVSPRLGRGRPMFNRRCDPTSLMRGVLFISFLLHALSAAAQPNSVQSASANDHYNSASATAQFASNVAANDAIAAFCVWEGTSQTLNGVTDTQGNTYTIVD